MSAVEYIKLIAARGDLIARVTAATADFDALLMPSVAMTAPPIAAAAPPPVTSMTCLTASGAALSIVATAPIWRACARFCASMSATITLPATAAGAMCTALPPTPPAPMITRWSSAPTCSRVFFSAESAVMPEQV